MGALNEPDNVNILTFDEADRAEHQQQQQQSPVPALPTTWRPGLLTFPNSSMRQSFFISEESVPSILPIDYNSLLENIRELNVLAGESEMHFEPQNGNSQRNISTLKRVEPIELTLYANGVFLFNGPFRSFSGKYIHLLSIVL